MDFELNEMKEIKSTEYDFNKILQKLSGLEDVKGYTPPVPEVKRIPDLDLILNCAGDNVNSQNYYKSLCNPMTELRKKTCYELSTPDINFVTDNFHEHTTKCDQYIKNVEDAYVIYTQIQKSPDTSETEKNQRIREIYANLNQIREGIYSQMNVLAEVATNVGNADQDDAANADQDDAANATPPIVNAANMDNVGNTADNKKTRNTTSNRNNKKTRNKTAKRDIV